MIIQDVFGTHMWNLHKTYITWNLHKMYSRSERGIYIRRTPDTNVEFTQDVLQIRSKTGQEQAKQRITKIPIQKVMRHRGGIPRQGREG